MTISIAFYHPGTDIERMADLETFCPQCSAAFEPDPLEHQSEIDAPFEVHCTRCGTLALRWAPPPAPVSPPEPTE